MCRSKKHVSVINHGLSPFSATSKFQRELTCATERNTKNGRDELPTFVVREVKTTTYRPLLIIERSDELATPCNHGAHLRS